MPDLSTLATLHDLKLNGWSMGFACTGCGHRSSLFWMIIERHLGNLHVGLDSPSIAWKLKGRCSKCGAKGGVKIEYTPPEPEV